MSSDSAYCMVLTTTASAQQAEELAQAIIAAKLAACVQVQQVQSYYRWEGQVRNEPECLLFIKTRSDQYQALEQFISANHAYETPEIVQLPIIKGSGAYLRWIDEVTRA